jgi:sialate O-acetylesterase
MPSSVFIICSLLKIITDFTAGNGVKDFKEIYPSFLLSVYDNKSSETVINFSHSAKLYGEGFVAKSKLLSEVNCMDTGVNYIKLPKIFTNSMVLQRDQKIPVWGWASPGREIIVHLKNQEQKIKADAFGKWLIYLKPERAGGPFRLIVSGTKEKIVIDDVLIGDVWICSGQSNMSFTVKRSKNAEEEIKFADNNFIRQFYVQQSVSMQPEQDVKGGEWKICTPETAGNFTAVGYFFARELFSNLKVPVGIINSSVGGTHIETWISKSAYQEDDYFRDMIAKVPSVTIDELLKQRAEEINKKIDSAQGGLPALNEKNEWMNVSYDDSKWAQMDQTGMWESKGWQRLDGKVWFRKIFNVDDADIEKKAVLELGTIDDTDESFINGIKVGSTKNKPAQERIYSIEPGVLKPGENIIGVFIEDVGGGGGFGSAAGKIKLTLGNTVIPLAAKWKYKIESFSTSGFNVNANIYPSLLFNAMINPLMPFGIKGAIWYQGESNTGRAYEYRKTFPLLIKDWRKGWGRGDFPFLFVQLPNFIAQPEDIQRGSTWAELREAQAMALAVPKTGMAVTIDIGEPKDIHPTNKQEVARRLAKIALSEVYKRKLEYTGPVFKSMKTEGSRAILSFDHISNGLILTNATNINGFTIAGADKVFYYAKAYFDGKSVVVYHEKVAHALSVRYAWTDNPEGLNFFNKEGYPAMPFRTDTWDGITINRYYQIAN